MNKTPTATETNAPAARLRLALRAAGYNARQVTVRDGGGSMSTALKVTVRVAGVSVSAIEKIAGAMRQVRHCAATGEILSGGNTFVDVAYAPEVYASLAATYAAALAAGQTKIGAFSVTAPAGEGFYFWSSPGADVPERTWGAGFTAKRMAIAMIDAAASAAMVVAA